MSHTVNKITQLDCEISTEMENHIIYMNELYNGENNIFNSLSINEKHMNNKLKDT